MSAKGKRKRVVLTIQDKVEIIDLLKKGYSYAAISQKYGIGKSTVGDIKKNQEKILKFKGELVDMGTRREVKVMKLGDDQQLDKAVYLWFRQKRMEGVPVSGPLLCEKAAELSKLIHGEATKFTASEGWKWRFCRRHGIRQLSVVGEKLSADTEAAETFLPAFQKLLKEKRFSLNQIFNCDETGLNFRLLPDVTLAAAFEKRADGRKKSKERVTLNACANASGTIKLPLHLIGKAQRPRCFKGLNMKVLPVKYSGQTNAWMTCQLFHNWFHSEFVPFVRQKLKSIGEKPRAILLLDNCSAHPDEKELVSDDGAIFAKFLPPNVTALIQPMDQGVLKALKLRYKKKLLRRLIIEDDLGGSMVDFLKSVNMKTVIDLVAEAWDEIDKTTLRKSWRKIIPISPPRRVPELLEYMFELARAECDEEEENTLTSSPPSSHSRSSGRGIWRGLRVRIRHTAELDPEVGEATEEIKVSEATGKIKVGKATREIKVGEATREITDGERVHAQEITEGLDAAEFQSMFEQLGFKIDENDITEWLESDSGDSGVQTFTDEEICEMVSSEPTKDVEEDTTEEQPASHPNV